MVLLSLLACVPVLTSPDGDEPAAPWVAPENDWPMGTVPDGLEGEGWAEGQVVEDDRWQDQYGQEVSMWQFYGSLIVLDISTIWCRPCQELAADVQATADDYADQGLIYLTVMPENLDGEIPDQDDLNFWGDSFGITAPILADDQGTSAQVLPTADYPGVFLISRSMVNLGRVQPATDESIRAAIDAAI